MAEPTYLDSEFGDASAASSITLDANLTHTGDDRGLFVGQYLGAASPPTLTGADWEDGTPTSFNSDQLDTTVFGSFFRRTTWFSVGLASGTNGVTLSMSGNCDTSMIASSYNNCHQTTQDGNQQEYGVTTGTGTGSNTLTTTGGVSGNDLVVSFGLCGDPNLNGSLTADTSETGHTQRLAQVSDDYANDTRLVLSDRGVDDGSAVTIDWTGKSSGDPVGQFAFVVRGTDSAVSGSLAETTENFTVSGDGGVHVSGSLAETTEAFTVSAAGNLIKVGSLAETMDAFTLAASGTASSGAGGTVTGSLAETLENFTSSSEGDYKISGTLASTLDSFTATVDGGVHVEGTLNTTLANFISQGEGGDPGIDTGFINRGGVIMAAIRRRR